MYMYTQPYILCISHETARSVKFPVALPYLNLYKCNKHYDLYVEFIILGFSGILFNI